MGTFSPRADSVYGVADVLSGSFEWTRDWFNSDYYADYEARAPHRNPMGPFWGRSHAIRGFPTDLHYNVEAVETASPLSLRYEWIFDHMLGDCFANRQSTFRLAFSPQEREPSWTGGSEPFGAAASSAASTR